MTPTTTYLTPEAIQLTKFKDGDHTAFGYVYSQYRLLVYRKLLRLVKFDSIADDLLQNIFIKLWDKRDLIDPERSLKWYLFQITQNMVMDFYRDLARKQRLQTEYKYAASNIAETTEEALLYKETSELLYQAINLLPARQGAVFKLCKIEGKSYDEVSALLGISISTVNGTIVKASKKVKLYILNAHKTLNFAIMPTPSSVMN